MDANTVTAVCATGIAVGSLAVSVAEGRAMRLHNRHSVRPLLQLWYVRRSTEHWAGLKLMNCGLGPAIVTKTAVTLDAEIIGA